jgi:hypothetical protein
MVGLISSTLKYQRRVEAKRKTSQRLDVAAGRQAAHPRTLRVYCLIHRLGRMNGDGNVQRLVIQFLNIFNILNIFSISSILNTQYSILNTDFFNIELFQYRVILSIEY